MGTVVQVRFLPHLARPAASLSRRKPMSTWDTERSNTPPVLSRLAAAAITGRFRPDVEVVMVFSVSALRPVAGICCIGSAAQQPQVAVRTDPGRSRRHDPMPANQL